MHKAPWPQGNACPDAAIERLLISLSAVLFAIRKAKSDASQSMKAPVASVELVDSAAQLEMIKGVSQDLIEAGQVEALVFIRGSGAVGRSLADVTLGGPARLSDTHRGGPDHTSD